jgi:hypothetical protein
MNHTIRPIDLKAGMFVIISRWYDEDPDVKTKTSEGIFGPVEVEVKRKPVGDPMKVLAIALPYITVDIIQHKQRGVLDTRLNEFLKVDIGYVRSLCPDYGKKERKMTDGEKRIRDGESVPGKIFIASTGTWEEIAKRGRKI